MPSRRGFFHHINQAQSPNSNNQSGRAEWRLYSVNGVNCWDWHWIRPPVVLLLVAHGPCIWNWSENEQTRDRSISIGSEYPVLDLSNGTGTGEAIGLIGRVSPTGMWSSRSYLRKDQVDPYTFIDQTETNRSHVIDRATLEFCFIKQGLSRLFIFLSYISGGIGKKRDKTSNG